MNLAAEKVKQAIASFRFSEAAQSVYEFFWNDFCDWYIEISKLKLYDENDSVKDSAASLLLYVLEESLRLLHPFLSFITEEIYQKLPEQVRYDAVVTAAYPTAKENRVNQNVAEQVVLLQELVRGIRTLRSEFNIPPGKKIRAAVRIDEGFTARSFFEKHLSVIQELTQFSDCSIRTQMPSKEGSIPIAGNGFETFLYIQDAIDIEAEIAKLQKEQEKLSGQLQKVANKLKNENFLDKAPAAIVEKEKGIEAELSGKLEKIGRHIQDLSGVK